MIHSLMLLKIQFPSVSGLQDVELGLCMSLNMKMVNLFKLFILLRTIGSLFLLLA